MYSSTDSDAELSIQQLQHGKPDLLFCNPDCPRPNPAGGRAMGPPGFPSLPLGREKLFPPKDTVTMVNNTPRTMVLVTASTLVFRWRRPDSGRRLGANSRAVQSEPSRKERRRPRLGRPHLRVTYQAGDLCSSDRHPPVLLPEASHSLPLPSSCRGLALWKPGGKAFLGRKRRRLSRPHGRAGRQPLR